MEIISTAERAIKRERIFHEGETYRRIEWENGTIVWESISFDGDDEYADGPLEKIYQLIFIHGINPDEPLMDIQKPHKYVETIFYDNEMFSRATSTETGKVEWAGLTNRADEIYDKAQLEIIYQDTINMAKKKDKKEKAKKSLKMEHAKMPEFLYFIQNPASTKRNLAMVVTQSLFYNSTPLICENPNEPQRVWQLSPGELNNVKFYEGPDILEVLLEGVKAKVKDPSATAVGKQFAKDMQKPPKVKAIAKKDKRTTKKR